MQSPNEIHERLLTGTLSEDEREDLERRALEDDDLFEALSIAEDEVIDAHVRGELSADESRHLERAIASSPRLRRSARVARLLARASDSAAPSSPRHRSSRPARVALAAAVLALAVGLPLLWFQQQDPGGGSVDGPDPYTLVLQPTSARDPGTAEPPTPHPLPAGVERLALHLELDPDPQLDAGVFDVRIIDAAGDVAWTGTGLPVRRLDWGDAVVLALAADPWRGRPHEAQLLLAGETPEVIAVYPFFLADP